VQTKPAYDLKAMEATYPPWQRGTNNDAIDRGLEFTVPLADVLADFHGSLDHPELVLYASGNSFFAMAPLVKAFGEAHPEYRGITKRCRSACCSGRWTPAAPLLPAT